MENEDITEHFIYDDTMYDRENLDLSLKNEKDSDIHKIVDKTVNNADTKQHKSVTSDHSKSTKQKLNNTDNIQNSKQDTFVFKLGETKFQNLDPQLQLAVIKRGRPLPPINIEVDGKSRGKTYKRQFNEDIYFRNNWICGSVQKNALFCFPCTLFGVEGEEKSWRKNGVRDLIHLNEKLKKHETSRVHISNELKFGLFGKASIQDQLESAYWLNIQKHNEEVTNNRYVLSKFIDCIKFCGAFELALKEHDESSENPGIFRGLVNFTSELDRTLGQHLKNAAIFKGTSKLQNDILDCMLEVYREEILREINIAPFLAVMCDETANVSSKFEMVIILRYITKEGNGVERFWTFLPPENHSAVSLASNIFNVVDPILKNDKKKLIAQCYDGAAVMSGKHGGVHALIKERYKNAHFVHCYAHQLNSVMSRACSINSQVRAFFGDLHDIPAFFNQSPKRLVVLNRFIGKNVPHSAPTKWNFNIRTVNVIYEHRDSIMDCVRHLEEDSNAVTCKEARNVLRVLEDSNFTFWLTVFHYIMPHVEVLYNELQKKDLNPTNTQNMVNNFEKSINNVRIKIDPIIQQASIFSSDNDTKRKRLNDEDHRSACVEVCDVIIKNAKERFTFTNHLGAASLFNSDNFDNYNRSFPEYNLDLTCEAYSLEKQRLRTELSVLYSNFQCRALKGAVPLLKFIISNKLDETLVETKKLLEILVTTPMITAEAERTFSTLNRIKTFLKNSTCEDCLPALLMLSIEKKFVTSVPNFNEKVIDRFAAKESRIELQFKTMN